MMAAHTTIFRDGRMIVEIQAWGPISAENAERESVHHDFILDHWRVLAGALYHGFQTQGRGALLLYEPVHIEVPAYFHPFMIHQLTYCTSLMELPLGVAPLTDWEHHQILQYDPETQGLIVIVDMAGHPRLYRIEATHTPRQAQRALQALLN